MQTRLKWQILEYVPNEYDMNIPFRITAEEKRSKLNRDKIQEFIPASAHSSRQLQRKKHVEHVEAYTKNVGFVRKLEENNLCSQSSRLTD